VQQKVKQKAKRKVQQKRKSNEEETRKNLSRHESITGEFRGIQGGEFDTVKILRF